MPNAAIPVFVSVLWLLVVLVMVTLWFVAMSDIASRTRTNLFSRTQLASMAAVVSVVAVMSVGAASAVFFQLPTGPIAMKSGGSTGANDTGCRGSRGSFVFSFGLEWAPHPSNHGTGGDTRAGVRGSCRTHI